MSILLDELIKDRKSRAIAYEEYLKKVIDLAKQAKEPQNTSSYPSSLNTPAKRALYDNLEQNEVLAIELDKSHSLSDWTKRPLSDKQIEAERQKIGKTFLKGDGYEV